MARRPHTRKKRPARRWLMRLLLVLAVLLAAVLAVWGWLASLPDAQPDAPPAESAPERVAAPSAPPILRKLVLPPVDVEQCRETLARAAAFTVLPAEGEGACSHTDRTVLTDFPLAPDVPAMTCPVAASLLRWRDEVAAPAARDIMGSELATIEHFGAYSCRRRGESEDAQWSEHATGNAIDIGGFVLADGRRISVLDDWRGGGAEARFLRKLRDGACESFSTVISPDYDAAHADHLHFDQKPRGFGMCD